MHDDRSPSAGPPASAPSTEAQRRFRAADALFDTLLDLPLPERGAALAAACTDDSPLREAVERLLRAHDATPDFLETPAGTFAAPMLASTMTGVSAPIPMQLGPFRVLRALGEGGMGTVYLAERVDAGFAQQVAIKTVRTSSRTPGLVERFLAERRILARIEHPNVARLIDGGLSTDGMPWFAMEYVQGEPLDTWCDAQRLTVSQRLAIYDTICDAVQFAHQLLVVHRDLKPSNILVTADGQVKLLDFGIAKVLADDGGDADVTVTAMAAMTPQYAAPEQLSGGTVSAATDVYALGMLLCELLTGHRPYNLRGLAPTEAMRVVCDVEPVRLTRLPLDGAAARATTPERLRRTLAGDLESIVAKALRKTPADRYVTVAALREDLARWRDGLPVRARPDDLPYRMRRFVSRHRVPVLAGVAAVVVATAAFVRERALRTEAQVAARKAEAVASYMVDVFDVADPNARDDATPDKMTVREVLDRGARRVEERGTLDAESEAQFRMALGRVYYNLGLFDESLKQARGALTQRKARFGAQHADVAESMDLAGAALARLDKQDEAERLLRDALSQRRVLLGDDAQVTAVSMEHLATLLQDRVKLPEARALFEEALAVRRLAPASRKRDQELAQAMNNLGLVRFVMGDYDAASQIYREAMPIHARAMGANNVLMAQMQQNLAQAEQLRGNLDSAEVLFRQALATKRRVLGNAHPSVTISLNNLSNLLYRDVGKLAEAKVLAEEAITLDRQIFGPTHSYVAAGLNNLGTVLRLQGDLDGSERTLRESLRISRAATAGRSRETAYSLNLLGNTQLAKGEFAPAIATLEEARAMYAALLGGTHVQTLGSIVTLGRALRESGKTAAAEARYREVLAGLDSTKPAHRNVMISAVNGLARVLITRGRSGDALALLVPWEAISAQRLGASNYRTVEARMVLAEAKAAGGDTVAAVALVQALRTPMPRVRIIQPHLGVEYDRVLAALSGAGARARS